MLPRRLAFGLSVGLSIIVAPIASAEGLESTCESLIQQSSAQLDAMRRHTLAIEQSVRKLSDALADAEHRNAAQTRHIERLQDELAEARLREPNEQELQHREFFLALRRQLPASVLYEILPDRLVVAIDPIFISGEGEIGAEGRQRLEPLVAVLRDLVQRLNERYPWRLRIEGHSDSRPVRPGRKFRNNWELSTSRALSMLEFFVDRGLPEGRLTAVGLADTQKRDSGKNAAAHRRNRRIEIRLVYPTAD